MVLKGEGAVVISVNGLEIFEYTFPDGENEVVIDSEKEDAYLGDVLKNRNMNGEFPVLLPGTNIIEWSGSVSSIEILPRSRWL
jgi:phage-related protein